MKAPDKIYFPEYCDVAFTIKKDGDVEYVRKDILLGKLLLAMKLRTDNAPEMLDSDGVQTIKAIISYIESL